MLSCDTFALTKKYFRENENCLAKNSDRPLGEAQPLSFFPGGEHEEGEMLTCTHLTIPQAKKTYTVLGSRPYWIWGFEMGVNEMGLMIGNEAQGSRCEEETEEGLLGMDLLRLALERTATAREGVLLIGKLLRQYGQNANASQLFDRRYENSFLLIDRESIWLMETAGRNWAAREIHDWAAISNCYSIGTDYDLCSDGMEEFVRGKRWLRPQEPIDFAKAFTQPAVRQERSIPRWRRMQKLIAAQAGPLDFGAVSAVLRDHHEDEILAPRWGAAVGTFISVCMHASTWDGSQTAASLIAHWDQDLGPVSWYAPSIPCCSVYLPIYWTGKTPASMERAQSVYSPDSLWWAAQRLAMLISVDEERFGMKAQNALRAMEEKIRREAEDIQEEARKMLKNQGREETFALLNQFMEKKTAQTLSLFTALSDEISSAIETDGGLYGIRKEFLEDYARKTGLKL